MFYNLKIKRKKEAGFWNHGINANTEKEAIEEAKNYIKTIENVDYSILDEEIIRWKKVAILEAEE